jgi:glycosyltransferase involved in cell wall biosynthesis
MFDVDVIVPCFRYGKYLRECIDSILSQRDVRVRVLIVDDASPDATREIAEDLRSRDSRINYHRNPVNKGVVGTANVGLEWATAEYSLMHSADDALTPGALARAASALAMHSDVGFCFGAAVIAIGDAKFPALPKPERAEFQVIPGRTFLKRVFHEGNPVPATTAVVRTAILKEVGSVATNLLHTADMEMWMRLAAHAPVGVLNGVQAYYRRHDSNLSTQFYNRPLGDSEERIMTCRQVCAAHVDRFPELRLWITEMERLISNEALKKASWNYEFGDNDAWREQLRFAQRFGRGQAFTPTYWKFVAKRIVGRRNLKRLGRSPWTLGENWGQTPGQRIGWWPSDNEIRVVSHAPEADMISRDVRLAQLD